MAIGATPPLALLIGSPYFPLIAGFCWALAEKGNDAPIEFAGSESPLQHARASPGTGRTHPSACAHSSAAPYVPLSTGSLGLAEAGAQGTANHLPRSQGLDGS